MSQPKEQVAADLVWRYVEHLRAAEAEGRSAALSRADLEQLVEALETASRLPEALRVEESEQCHAAVRDRLSAALAAPPGAPPRPEPAASPDEVSPLFGLIPPVWALRVAAAGLLALSMALATVNLWHQPAPRVVVKRVPVPRDLPDVKALDEPQAHRLIPRLVHNRISRNDERNLMWHMLVCPGCFDEYVRERGEHSPQQTARNSRTPDIQLIRW